MGKEILLPLLLLAAWVDGDAEDGDGMSEPVPTSEADLETLAYHFGTDKGHDDHKYTDLYSMLFDPLRNIVQNVTEVGIAAGQSLWLWHDYFPHAQVWGVDIDRNQVRNMEAKLRRATARVRLLLGDVTNASVVASLGFAPESMDIIIDDGPHRADRNEQILINLFRYVRPGGYYCIEDVQTGIEKSDERYYPSKASKPGWAHLAHAAHKGGLDDIATQIMRDHDVAFVDTLVGHRAYGAFLSRLGRKWARDSIDHNSHVLVIRKRKFARQRDIVMNTRDGAMVRWHGENYTESMFKRRSSSVKKLRRMFSAEAWLTNSSTPHRQCAPVITIKDGMGNCEGGGSHGAFFISMNHTSWLQLTKACLQKCAACSSCHHISVSIHRRACIWHNVCYKWKSTPGFRFGAVLPNWRDPPKKKVGIS